MVVAHHAPARRLIVNKRTERAAENRCILYAAKYYGIHPLVIEAVKQVEGGKPGMVKPNSNGTYDLGIMQINTSNLPLIHRYFPTVTWREIADSPCVNIGVAVWFLKRNIVKAGNIWAGVGNYHSATPRYHRRYLRRIASVYARLLRHYYRIAIR